MSPSFPMAQTQPCSTHLPTHPQFAKAWGLKITTSSCMPGRMASPTTSVLSLQAANKLTSEPMIHFLLVGGGKDKPALMQQAEKLQLTNLTFLPARSKTEMPALIGASDACLAILKPIDAFKTTYPKQGV